MNIMGLLLADSRFPGGGHAHSGGLEEAAARGLIRTEEDLPAFLRNRLRTAGALAATFAAAAAHPTADWQSLDEELDARTPSPAQRAASRAQGKATARAARAMLPTLTAPANPPKPPTPAASPAPAAQADSLEHADSPALAESVEFGGGVAVASGPSGRQALAALLSAASRPHHPVVLGAVVGAGGGSPGEAALAAAYLAVSGPASASVRLLGLDPLRVNALVAALGHEVAAVAREAAATAHLPPADLPAPGSPGLDLLAEEHDRHHREEVRLFAS